MTRWIARPSWCLALVLAVVMTTTLLIVATGPAHDTYHRVESYSFDPAPSPSKPANCFNVACPPPGTSLSDHNGPVLTHPIVYLVQFSNTRSGVSPISTEPYKLFNTRAPNARGIVMATLTGGYSSLYKEYMRTGAPYQGATYGGMQTWYSPHLATSPVITDNQIKSAIRTHLGAVSRTAPTRSQPIYVIFGRLNQKINAFGTDSQLGFCAYHSGVSLSKNHPVAYIVMPYEASSPSCDHAATPHASIVDKYSPILSHELAETVTDPYGALAWAQNQTYAELADLCAVSGPDFTSVAWQGVSYPLSPLFSNVAHTCVTGPTRTLLYATLTSPSTLQILAVSDVGPLVSQPVSVATSQSLLTTTTSSSGEATIELPTAPVGPIVVSFAGDSPLLPSTTTIDPAPTPPALTAVASPPAYADGSLGPRSTISATLDSASAPIAGAQLYLVAFNQTILSSAATNQNGVAIFNVGQDGVCT